MTTATAVIAAAVAEAFDPATSALLQRELAAEPPPETEARIVADLVLQLVHNKSNSAENVYATAARSLETVQAAVDKNIRAAIIASHERLLATIARSGDLTQKVDAFRVSMVETKELLTQLHGRLGPPLDQLQKQMEEVEMLQEVTDVLKGLRVLVQKTQLFNAHFGSLLQRLKAVQQVGSEVVYSTSLAKVARAQRDLESCFIGFLCLASRKAPASALAPLADNSCLSSLATLWSSVWEVLPPLEADFRLLGANGEVITTAARAMLNEALQQASKPPLKTACRVLLEYGGVSYLEPFLNPQLIDIVKSLLSAPSGAIPPASSYTPSPLRTDEHHNAISDTNASIFAALRKTHNLLFAVDGVLRGLQCDYPDLSSGVLEKLCRRVGEPIVVVRVSALPASSAMNSVAAPYFRNAIMNLATQASPDQVTQLVADVQQFLVEQKLVWEGQVRTAAPLPPYLPTGDDEDFENLFPAHFSGAVSDCQSDSLRKQPESSTTVAAMAPYRKAANEFIMRSRQVQQQQQQQQVHWGSSDPVTRAITLATQYAPV